MSPPLVYHPAYSVPLPAGHRFPMAKFRLLLEVLMRQELAGAGQLRRPLPAPRRWLELVHG
ncbi:MAG: histone deacetylase, partial [Synechococcaceae cyanobacterium]|nr:histone deacetylase [Synechococcaceae cyanobacterium]